MIGAPDINALIREEDRQEIIQGAIASSKAMQLCRKQPMSKRQSRTPVLNTLPEAYWVNGQKTEATAGDPDIGRKQLTKMAWADKVLTVEELAVIVPIHENDIADADFNVWGEVQPRLVEAMGDRIDHAVFFGQPGVDSPASFDSGLVPSSVAAGNAFQAGSVGGQLFDVDISKTMEAIELDGYMVNGAASAVNVKSRLRNLRDNTGQPIYLSDVRADGRTGSIYGEPLEFVQNGSWDPTQALMLMGDFSNAIIGVRQDITMKLFTEGVIQEPGTGNILYNLMQDDMVALRCVFRMAFCHVNPITRYNAGNATRFPFAALTV